MPDQPTSGAPDESGAPRRVQEYCPLNPRRIVSVLGPVTACLVATGCSAEPPNDIEPSPTQAGAQSAPPDKPKDIDVDIPDTPAGSQTRWVLDQLAASSGPAPDEAAIRFAEVFLRQIPADHMAATFAQLRGYGPFEPTGYFGTETSAQTALRNGSGEPMALEIAVDDAGVITGLFLRQLTEPPAVETWSDVDAAYADLPGARVLAAAVSDGTCEPAHTFGPVDEPAPLGSTFKLYVLGAVQQAVLDGHLAWDDTVTVTADNRVLTSPETDRLNNGTQVSIADAARSMMSVSDNTATDLLIDAVGREAVEQAVADMGHAEPAAMRPVLKTRELFVLGWTEPALREAWSDADEQGRRAILEALPDGPLDIDPAVVVDPVHHFGIDWFAAGSDVCAAHLALQRLAAADGHTVMRDLLAVNSGITFDAEIWAYVAYKGGSAPGELAGSWYVEGRDGSTYVLVLQFAGAEPSALHDLAYIFGVAGKAFDLFVDYEG